MNFVDRTSNTARNYLIRMKEIEALNNKENNEHRSISVSEHVRRMTATFVKQKTEAINNRRLTDEQV